MLEEKLRAVYGKTDNESRKTIKNPGVDDTEKEEIGTEVYIPSGADSTIGKKPALSTRQRTGYNPKEDLITSTPRARASAIATATTTSLKDTIRLRPRRSSVLSTESAWSQESHQPPCWPSKAQVVQRIRQEEAGRGLSLHEPDSLRQGSRDGPTVAAMVMSGHEDSQLVLPYLQYIKIHELRALEGWLANTMGMTSSGMISRIEKVLHCIQLLQIGCRYESLAVLFSRSPTQIKESCAEVMAGLLHLHSQTANKAGEQEMYMPLWKIWRKFEATDGRVGLYYGFRWLELAKVLVTLNLYIGRWRMQGMFATDGPTFVWGRFFVSAGPSGPPKAGEGQAGGIAYDSGDDGGTGDDDDDELADGVNDKGDTSTIRLDTTILQVTRDHQ